MLKSQIWLHFDKIRDNKASCRHCSTIFNLAKRSSTSNLWAHFRLKHEGAVLQTQHVTLDSFLEDPIEKQLISMIAATNSSLRIVESKSFQKFCRNCPKNFDFPSRTKCRALLTTYANEIDDLTRKKLRDCLSLSLTTDTWSTPNCKKNFLSLTCNILSSSLEMESLILDCFVLDEKRHTADYLRSCLEERLDFFGITSEKLIGIVADGGANIRRAILDTGTNYYHCAAHIINILIQKMLEQPFIASLTRKLQELVRSMHTSHVFNISLKRFCETFNEPFREIQGIVPTRWNSCFMCISDTLNCLNAVQSTLIEHKNDSFSPDEIHTMKFLKKVLIAPFSVTEELCKKFCPQSSVLPCLRYVEEQWEMISRDLTMTTSNRLFLVEWLNILRSSWSPYFGDRIRRFHCFLDPRFCMTKLFSTTQWREIEDDFLRTFETYDSSYDPDPIPEGLSRSAIYCGFVRDEANNTISTLKDEIIKYKTVLSRHRNWTKEALDFWKLYEIDMPCLGKLAFRFFTVQSTSVDSERLFSIAGILYGNKRRMRLKGSTARSLLIVGAHSNALETRDWSRNWMGRYCATYELESEEDEDELTNENDEQNDVEYHQSDEENSFFDNEIIEVI